jgi:ATP-binding cassette, subfamily F, member 3
LDEPTNFLDITSIRWIERFLCHWRHELVLITHDRSFMDKVVSHTLGIHRRKVRKIAGNTAKYYDQIAQDEEIYEKTRVNDDRRRKEIEQFIVRFRAKARLANLVQSRIKTLRKMEKKEKLERLKTLDFSFRSIPMAGNQALTARRLTFAYDHQSALIKNFNITINPGERVCVVGKNGKGKTTLLKLLAGELQPQGGDVFYHPAVKIGFYEQTNIQSLVADRTVEEEILYSHTGVDRQLARNICGAMLFAEDEALKKVSVLSGGEKSRVMLGKLLATPLNLLLLDEPSNHLDMESCDALLAAIDSFEGTVIMVTHNEMFLHTLAERLIVFQNDTIELFNGSYQEFLEGVGWLDEFPSAAPERPETPAIAKNAKRTKKEIRRRRSDIISRRSKAVKPLEERIMRLENDIHVRETELHQLNDLIQKASQAQDGLQIAELGRAIHVCQSSIDQLFVDLEQATHELDTQNEFFEQQLQELEPDYPK